MILDDLGTKNPQTLDSNFSAHTQFRPLCYCFDIDWRLAVPLPSGSCTASPGSNWAPLLLHTHTHTRTHIATARDQWSCHQHPPRSTIKTIMTALFSSGSMSLLLNIVYPQPQMVLGVNHRKGLIVSNRETDSSVTKPKPKLKPYFCNSLVTCVSQGKCSMRWVLLASTWNSYSATWEGKSNLH